jgi:excisionase family DNA binding protein
VAEPTEIRRDPDALLTVADVASLLRVSQAFVRHHASGFRQPRIPSIKLGKSVRFQRREVLRFVNSLKRSA